MPHRNAVYRTAAFDKIGIMADTILVVDDEVHVRLMLQDYLTAQGYRVAMAADGREALFVAREQPPDLILLDVMMPELGGLDFIRQHRRDHATPIILITARVEEVDKIIGLELGADDYITKPFSLREVLARVRAVLRRTRSAATPDEIHRVQDVTVHLGQHHAEVAGQTLQLTPSEFNLLAVLIQAPDRVFSRHDLHDCLHADDDAGTARTIDVHIRNLRTKLEPDPKAPRYIQTVYGAGYRFASGS
ncbi:MAG: response regulator transcription factor [Bacteroidota bacterium]